MTYLEALYGGQYYELQQSGRNPEKGRLNGNLLLAAIIVLMTVVVILVITNLASSFSQLHDLERGIKSFVVSGKFGGKIMGLILFLVVYLILTTTIGSEKKYHQYVASFLALPDGEKKKANKKFLIPFFILLTIFVMLLFAGLWKSNS